MPPRRSAGVALLLLVPVPTLALIVVLFGPVDETGESSRATQILWALGKVWTLALPIAWHVLVDRQRAAFPRPRREGMPAALASGTLILIGILVVYYTLGHRWIDEAAASESIADRGLDTLPIYVAMALYWCTVNSLLEEYVWRWFVFTRCEVLMPRHVALFASALLFTVHHVIAMAVFFEDLRVVVLASTGVFIGGATWSWIYLRWRNIYAAWLSHVFADVAVFWIGYRIVF